jgi:hypothetical protein
VGSVERGRDQLDLEMMTLKHLMQVMILKKVYLKMTQLKSTALFTLEMRLLRFRWKVSRKQHQNSVVKMRRK